MIKMAGRARSKVSETDTAPVDTSPQEVTQDAAPGEQTEAAPTFQVLPSTGMVASEREGKPNPLKGVVRPTLEQGAQMLRVANAEQAKNVTSWLRRDAKEEDLALSVQYQDDAGNKVEQDEATSVHFRASIEKRSRRYTKNDIVKWAQENEAVNWDGKGKVPSEVREAFKSAHNY